MPRRTPLKAIAWMCFTTLVEAYEAHHYPIPEPDPVEAIKYYMESRGLSRADLEPYIGGRTHAWRKCSTESARFAQHDPATVCWLGHPGRSACQTLRCG